ncbi:GNAT family N-acetyltransferase [Pseudonocardiaceae bacterium YIM PH 21723]|nr:GNAT family N-acetyltransferase [Pseudonocardiaceae bacterium YIM PH 21723]
MAIAAVRTADTSDVSEITRIQREVWRTAYREFLPEQALALIESEQALAAWDAAVRREDAIVLVATEGEWTVGFCAASISSTTTAIATLLVEPRWGRRGHGGRLLGTLAERMREHGAYLGEVWVAEADTASLGFFQRAGWDLDGTARTLDADGRTLRELHVTGKLDLQLVD